MKEVLEYVRLADIVRGDDQQVRTFIMGKKNELSRQLELLGLAREFDEYFGYSSVE